MPQVDPVAKQSAGHTEVLCKLQQSRKPAVATRIEKVLLRQRQFRCGSSDLYKYTKSCPEGKFMGMSIPSVIHDGECLGK